MLGTFVVRAHCDKVVNLSGVLPSIAPYKETVCNVHGIRNDFFGSSSDCTSKTRSSPHCQVYFIGKVLWEKGFDKLLDLEAMYKKKTGNFFEIDIYGSGPDETEIKRAFYGRERRQPEGISSVSSSDSGDDESTGETAAPTGSATLPAAPLSKRDKISSIIEDLPRSRYELRKLPVPARFLGRRDHAQLKGMYKVFVNCSISEVLCTTTAESIAMGNWVIIPDHESNKFFSRFPSVLMYGSKAEFVDNLQYALKNDPPKLSEALARELTWEAATERFIEAAAMTKREARRNERMGYAASDARSAKFHAEFGAKKEGIAFKGMFLGNEEDAGGSAIRPSVWKSANDFMAAASSSIAVRGKITRKSLFHSASVPVS